MQVENRSNITVSPMCVFVSQSTYIRVNLSRLFGH